MIAARRRGLEADRQRGLTLVEMLVSITLLTVVMGLSTTLFLSMMKVTRYTDAYSQNLAALRQAAARLTAEVREATQIVTTSTSTSLTIWVDSDRDATQDTGEVVTYALANGTDASGASIVQLRRSVNGTSGYRLAAQGLSNTAAFTYYTNGLAGAASATTSMVAVQFTGNVTVAGQHPTPPVVTTKIFLRNQ